MAARGNGAPGGREAIDFPRDTMPPRLLILDCNMPHVSGLDVLAFVRADPRLAGVPVVIYSSDSYDASREATPGPNQLLRDDRLRGDGI